MTKSIGEKIRERREHLMQLGFTLDEVAHGSLCLDDALWEQAKDLPPNPDCEYCRWNRRLEEMDRKREEEE